MLQATRREERKRPLGGGVVALGCTHSLHGQHPLHSSILAASPGSSSLLMGWGRSRIPQRLGPAPSWRPWMAPGLDWPSPDCYAHMWRESEGGRSLFPFSLQLSISDK